MILLNRNKFPEHICPSVWSNLTFWAHYPDLTLQDLSSRPRASLGNLGLTELIFLGENALRKMFLGKARFIIYVKNSQ